MNIGSRPPITVLVCGIGLTTFAYFARQEKETNKRTKKNNILECDHLCERLRAVS